jgi:hypothetical protein
MARASIRAARAERLLDIKKSANKTKSNSANLETHCGDPVDMAHVGIFTGSLAGR